MQLLVTTDRFALESALALRGADDEVLAAAVGDAEIEDELRHALAMGADRAVRVWDEGLADLWAEQPGAGGLDELALATVLAHVARVERPGLILCRAQSPTFDDDVIGIALAGLLELAHAYDVIGVERDGERFTVQRRLDAGRAELIRISAPALLAVRTGSNAPRQPDLRAVKRARERPIVLLGLRELDAEADAVRESAGARVVALDERPTHASARPIEGSPAEIAARNVEIAKERVAS